MSRAVFGILLVAAVIVGATLRVPQLSLRPMHCDEAVHAIKFSELWQHGRYVYDPSEYHGPTLYYAALPVVWLGGARNFGELSAAALRLTPVVFGLALIGLVALVADGIGRPAAACAAALTAVSPAFVYYSRYYIQEMLLVFFTFGLIASAWRFSCGPRRAWAVVGGICFGLMHATKETCLIAWACLALSTLLIVLPRIGGWRHLAEWAKRHRTSLAMSAAAAAATSFTLFTAFFTNWRGPIDSLLTYATYFDRAGNHGLHDHPWFFYWQRLLYWKPGAAPLWSEAFVVVLAAIGMIVSARAAPGDAKPLARVITLYTLLLAAIYTAIPYKTPWCMLGFMHGMILLAGIGAAALIQHYQRTAARAALFAVLLAGGAHLALQAQRSTSPKFAADHRNPYVYAHTVNDLVSLATWVERLAAVHPLRSGMPVHVIATHDDFWPLPWYLRRLTHVGWWSSIPDEPDAAVVIASTDLQPELESRLRDSYPRISIYGLRPATQLVVNTRADAWNAFLATQSASPASAEATNAPRAEALP